MKSLIELNKNNICFFNLSPQNIVFNLDCGEKPILNNFQLSLQISHLNQSYITNIINKTDDYTYKPLEINTHGTSTPVGDTKEIEAMKEVFKDKVPPFSSTKSITGHSLGATSVQEAIYCLLMMKNKFIAASANVKDLDEKIKGLPIVTEVKKNIELNCVMSNSFGFGGTNATLVFESL